MRCYNLPEMAAGETNQDWCRRAAESIPASELVRLLELHSIKLGRFRPKWLQGVLDLKGSDEAKIICLVRELDRHHKRPAWSFVGEITCHGSGVSAAIVHRFAEMGREGRA